MRITVRQPQAWNRGAVFIVDYIRDSPKQKIRWLKGEFGNRSVGVWLTLQDLIPVALRQCHVR